MTAGSNHKSILLIDDEIPVITALQKYLQKKGFSVEIKESSTSGLEMIRENPSKFDLLITDLTMPDMNGVNLAEQVHLLNPELPILIMTGYGDDVYTNDLEAFGVRGILNKPFKLKELASIIASLLID